MSEDSRVSPEPGKTRMEHHYLANMLKIIDASSDSTTTEEAYESTISQLVEITGLTGMALVLRADNRYALVTSNGLSESLSGNIGRYPEEFSGIFEALEDATEPIPFYDANNEKFFPAQFRHKMDYVDVVYIPIRHAGFLLGFLCIGKVEPGKWSHDDLAIFDVIGKLSGIIIYRAIVTE
ncbi:MAG: GAF domain-containing protein, partial [Coriobacteriaceae bacterium]|nr:GAF domain-containing protein [Coriobacteriaceae bacterium]